MAAAIVSQDGGVEVWGSGDDGSSLFEGMVLSAAEPLLPFRPCPRPSSQSPNPIPRHDPTLTLAQPPPPRRYRR